MGYIDIHIDKLYTVHIYIIYNYIYIIMGELWDHNPGFFCEHVGIKDG